MYLVGEYTVTEMLRESSAVTLLLQDFAYLPVLTGAEPLMSSFVVFPAFFTAFFTSSAARPLYLRSSSSMACAIVSMDTFLLTASPSLP